MRVLITGGSGFVGRHLVNHLVKSGDNVVLSSLHKLTDAELVGIPTKSQVINLDVTDKQAVSTIVNVLQPDVIYHLAAMTFVPDLESNQQQGIEVNGYSLLNLINAVSDHQLKTRIVFISSSEVYGEPRPMGQPLTEQHPLRPISFYGVTKSIAEIMGNQLAFKKEVDLVRVRPFAHTGPGQSSKFALSSFAKQIVESKNKKSVIKVGNLDVRRDYSDVADIVRGYREIALNGISGKVYNLCSSTPVSMRSLLDKLIDLAGSNVTVEVDPERVRNADIEEFFGSYAKINREIGWKPKIEIEDTLRGLLQYWDEELSR